MKLSGLEKNMAKYHVQNDRHQHPKQDVGNGKARNYVGRNNIKYYVSPQDRGEVPGQSGELRAPGESGE